MRNKMSIAALGDFKKIGTGEYRDGVLQYVVPFDHGEHRQSTITAFLREIGQAVFEPRHVSQKEYEMMLQNNKMYFRLKSLKAMCVLRDYIEMHAAADELCEYSRLCPISLRVPRTPAFIRCSTTTARYEKSELEKALAMRAIDPMTGVPLSSTEISEDSRMMAHNRKTFPFPLADLIADYQQTPAAHDERPPALIFRYGEETNMNVKGNPLIAEFLRRFSDNNGKKKIASEMDDSPDGVRQALYEILQDYQRDIRKKGMPTDWRLSREFRPGIFGKSTHKSFIFDGQLSIATSRERLFLVDGLQDTDQNQNVANPAEGSLMHALRPGAHINDYLELQQILERFSGDDDITDALKRRCALAKINPEKTCQILLGNARLGKFIHFVRTTLELHYAIERQDEYQKKLQSAASAKVKIKLSDKPPADFRHQPKRSGFRVTGKITRALRTVKKPAPPAPRKSKTYQAGASVSSGGGGGDFGATFLMVAALGCGSGCGGATGGCGSGCGGASGCGGCGGGCGG